MIKTHQILRKDSSILVGIALENAVLDILTNDLDLQNCLKLLQEPHCGLVSARIGSFGIYSVTLNLHHDDTVSVFIDGPEFDECRSQSAAIWPGKEELRRVLAEAVHGASLE